MMDKLKRSFLVTAIACLLMCLAVGKAMAGTVKVQTSSGDGACATYYTESGDWATGDAMVSPNGSVGLDTEGSVKMGLVRGGSGPGSGSFAPFTGEFSARTNSSGDASASSTDPRVDIFVVSQPGSSTVGNYTIDGNPGTPYTRFNSVGADIGAVDAAGGEANSLPDWILVDQGKYDERIAMDNNAVKANFEDGSAFTSVWGADHTTIDAGSSGSDGPGIYASGIDGFRVEGFTVTGARGFDIGQAPETWGHGIYVDDSPGATITCNNTTDNISGIVAVGSDNARIIKNTVSQNISGITAVLNSSVEIAENIVTENVSGIAAVLNSTARIRDNTVTENISGIAAVLNGNVIVAGNDVTENTSGVATVLNRNAIIINNKVSENVSGIAAVLNGNALVAGNDVTENTSGVATVLNRNAIIVNNKVSKNVSGIAAVLNRNVLIAGNEVTENVIGIGTLLNENVFIVNNDVTENVVGVAALFNTNNFILGNNINNNILDLIVIP